MKSFKLVASEVIHKLCKKNLLSVVLLLTFINCAYAQTNKTRALEEIITCSSVNFFSTAIYIPPNLIDSISELDNETKSELKKNQANLKMASEAYAKRMVFFEELFFEISNNRSTLYIQQLVAKHVQNMKIVNQDEAFGVKIANAYVKCQSYTEGLVRLKFQTKPSEFSDKAVTYIVENLSQKLTSTENLIGVMQISGLHWKHKEKMREKVTVESFKK
jgi:hypothetical protein